MLCQAGLYNHFSSQATLPEPLVTLTHHLLFGAPCWRCHHLKMSPWKYQQNHPIYLQWLVWGLVLFCCLAKRNTYVIGWWNSYVELSFCYHWGKGQDSMNQPFPTPFGFQRVVSERSHLFWGKVPHLGLPPTAVQACGNFSTLRWQGKCLPSSHRDQ